MLDQINIHTDIQPVIVFVITMAFSILLFAAARLVMQTLYTKFLYRWGYLAAKVEKLRQNGSPLVNKYGCLGLAVFVAVPLPGTGVVGGTILSWVIGLNWYTSFLVIITASAIPNLFTAAGIAGLMHLVNA